MGWILIIIIILMSVVVLSRRKKQKPLSNQDKLPPQRQQLQNTDMTFYDSDSLINIKPLKFFGGYKHSPNGALLLAIGETDPTNTYGQYVVLRENKVVLQGRLAHIGVGSEWAIADEGSFIIGYSKGEPLQSVFYAFNAQGEKVFKKTFHANLDSVGISDDGKYAVCQLANNKEHKDGGMLKFLEIPTKKVLWQHQPENGWASDYHFDIHQHILSLLYQEKETSRYTFQGESLNNNVS